MSDETTPGGMDSNASQPTKPKVEINLVLDDFCEDRLNGDDDDDALLRGLLRSDIELATRIAQVMADHERLDQWATIHKTRFACHVFSQSKHVILLRA